MKKLAALILCILAVFALAAMAQAEPAPEPAFTLEPMTFDPAEPVLLWDSVGFSIHSDTVRNSDVLFFYDEGAEPSFVWLDDNGYGEAWFTAGTTDTFIFDYEQDYNADHLVHEYQAYAQEMRDEGAKSNTVPFSTQMVTAEVPVFAPHVDFVSDSPLRQDDAFHAGIYNDGNWDVLCVVLFENDENKKLAVDSHWVNTEGAVACFDIATPLLRLTVNKTYEARAYALKKGYPLAWMAEPLGEVRVVSPLGADPNSDILISNLNSSYETGDIIMANVYYPNSEGLDNIWMEVSVYYNLPEAARHPDSWAFDRYLGQENDGSLYYQPETWDGPPEIWFAGEYVYKVVIWQEENGQLTKVDSSERVFAITSQGPLAYDPDLPPYIDAEEMPYTLSIPRLENATFYYISVENGDDHDWEAEPDWDSRIAEFNHVDNPEAVHEAVIDSVRQRVRVHIHAGTYGYDWYETDVTIPVVRFGNRVSIRTEEELMEENAEPLPIHSEFPIWVNAEGANWVRVENVNGEFYFSDNREDINRTIELNSSIEEIGANYYVATAGFYDEATDTETEEQALLLLQGSAVGTAGAFTASLDKNSVRRGEAATITYTKSENANHYWADLEIWHDDWGNNGDWGWYEHLADIYDDGQESIEAVLDTMTLEPSTYRVRAVAEGVGYERAEYIVTESFTVSEAQMPESGILVNVSDDDVQTCERVQVSAYAPGAEWMEVLWNYGNDPWWTSDNGGDSISRDQSYNQAGQYRVAVKAWYNEYKNGEQVWETDEESGERYPKQYAKVSDPVIVTVTAPHGTLTLERPEIGTKLPPSAEPQEISFTVNKPAEAEFLSVSAWMEGEEQNLYWKETEDNQLNVRFTTVLKIGQILRVSLHAQATGYNAADLDLSIPVAGEADSRALAVFRSDPEKDEVTVSVHQQVEVQIRPANEGDEIKVVRFFGGYNLWGGQPLGGDETFNARVEFDNEGTYTVFALVTFDPWKDEYNGLEEDPRTWISTNILTIHVAGQDVGPYDFASKDPVTVKWGEDAAFAFTAADSADNYWVDAWDANDSNRNFNPQTTWAIKDGKPTVTMNTASLPEGEYIIRGRAGVTDGGWRESDSSVRLIVTENDIPEGTLRLIAEKRAAMTNVQVPVSVLAPGADWTELMCRYPNGEEWDFAWGDQGAAGTITTSYEQVIEVFGRAHYYKRDANGERIPDGQDEWGNETYQELPYKDTESVSITFAAPNGQIVQDRSGIPSKATAGEDLTLAMPYPAEAAYMEWEIYLDRDDLNNDQEPDLRGRGALNKTIPGNQVAADHTIELRV